jgi:hypothetical protein
LTLVSVAGVAGWLHEQSVFANSEFGESCTNLFQTFILAMTTSGFVVAAMKNRGGNYDLTTKLSVRRRQMERAIE